jgi:hypothetical protein
MPFAPDSSHGKDRMPGKRSRQPAARRAGRARPVSQPAGPGSGFCIGCASPSQSWACPGCRASLDHVVAMLHAPRGELIATWLSIMTTDARLERGQDAVPAAATAPGAPSGESSVSRGASPAAEAGGRLAALGLIVERSAIMEQRIRVAFSALAGSTLAAAAIADQPPGWLIGSCEALASARQELPPPDRQAIKNALRRCRTASRRRADLERSLQAAAGTADDAGGTGVAAGSGSLNGASGQPWTTSEIRSAAADLHQAGLALASAIRQAFQPQPPLEEQQPEDQQPGRGQPEGRQPEREQPVQQPVRRPGC